LNKTLLTNFGKAVAVWWPTGHKLSHNCHIKPLTFGQIRDTIYK
jgi:hypothetical protein